MSVSLRAAFTYHPFNKNDRLAFAVLWTSTTPSVTTHYFFRWTFGPEPLIQSVISEGSCSSPNTPLDCSNGYCIPHYFNHTWRGGQGVSLNLPPISSKKHIWKKLLGKGYTWYEKLSFSLNNQIQLNPSLFKLHIENNMQYVYILKNKR